MTFLWSAASGVPDRTVERVPNNCLTLEMWTFPTLNYKKSDTMSP